MTTHTYKKCPYCGKTYETYTPMTKHYQSHMGSPFVKCRFCGKEFVDKDIKEPALVPYSEDGFGVGNCFFAGIMPFGCMGIMFTFLAIYSKEVHILSCVLAAIGYIGYLSCVIFRLKNQKKILEAWRNEYSLSEERLKNYSYALALRRIGFDVPDRFLHKGSNDREE